MEEFRPWGSFEVLFEENGFKVKLIKVEPGTRLSLQRHSRRSEHWFILEGVALAKKGEESIELKKGESIDIEVGEWHRVSNNGEGLLKFIEVLRGEYLGEDDIERSEDDYGRINIPKF